MNPGPAITSAVERAKELIGEGFKSFWGKGKDTVQHLTNAEDDRRDRNGKDDDRLTFQLIDGYGNFNDLGLMDFVREVKLSECGRSYAVIAIMGPQSSGKSTLLNHLFRTNFKEMNNSDGRSQTTLGVWLARCPDIEPLMLVMDIEGTDGTERGEDDTAFEKQSALFALAVADVVLINMWCHDIGREHAANKPLLRSVFQQVLIRFCNEPRNITLMFVIRDKTKSPEEKLEANLRGDLEKIWASIPKPSGSTNIQLRSFFKVQVEFLPNYEEKQKDFKLKVKTMKRRFNRSTAPRGLVGDRKEPASGFPILAENIWKDILENKDLNLPAHKVMVATIRCEEISSEKYDAFEINEGWCKLRKDAQLGFVPGFGKKVDSIVNASVSEYDAETLYFVEAVRAAKRKELVDKLLQLVEPVYRATLNHLRLEHLNKFMDEFDRDSGEQNRFSTIVDALVNRCLLEFHKDCADVSSERANWDTLKEMTKLQRDMNSYIVAKRDDKLASKIRRLYEPKLKQELSDSVGFVLCEETDPTWSKIRERFKSVMESTLLRLVDTLSEFGVDGEDKKEKLESMEKYAKDVVEAKAREESGRAKDHMLRKFLNRFKYDYDSSPDSPCDWNSNEEVEAAAMKALHTPLDVLAGLAAIRLEAGDADDDICHILHSALRSEEPNTLNHLDSQSWAQVPSSRTLITPIQCKQLWTEYLIQATDAVGKALKDLQKKQKKKPKWEQILKKIRSIITGIGTALGIGTSLAFIFGDKET